MSKSKQNYSNTCAICGGSFHSFGEYVKHYDQKHEQPPWRDKSLMRELYVEEELSSTAVAEELGCASSTVIKWLEKHGIERRDASETMLGMKFGDYGVTDEQKEKLNDKKWLVENYVSKGRSTCEIAEELDCSRQPVQNALEYFDIETRDPNWEGYDPEPGEQSDLPELYDEKWVRREYVEKDRRLEDIANDLGCSIAPVSYAVSRFNIKKDAYKSIRGENHPMWKGGRIEYGAEWYEKRQQRLEQDGYKCVVCGKSDKKHNDQHGHSLHVHHIKPVRSFDDPSDAHDLSNLVTLCVSCHNRWEGVPLRPQASA